MTTPSSYRKQSGVVLMISLVMLVLLTLIGVTAMQVTGLEEKMAGNMKSNNLAFQSAETALREGEAWLANPMISEPAIDSVNVWGANAMDPDPLDSMPWWFNSVRDETWWSNNAVQYATALEEFNVNTFNPYRIIEFKHFAPDTLGIGTNNTAPGINYYQVTARGTSPDGQSRQLVQSTTARRF